MTSPSDRHITEQDVRSTARLARLTFSDEEFRTLTDELRRVLEYVSQLDAVDSEGVAPLHMLHAQLLPLRTDTPSPSLSRDTTVQNAPAVRDGFVRVPRVL